MSHGEGCVGQSRVLKTGEVACGIGDNGAPALQEEEGEELIEGLEVLEGGGEDLGMFAEVGVESGGHLVDEGLRDCAQGETQVF